MENNYSNFPKDAINPGSVKGWGVVRMEPWHFAGLYLTEEAANAIQEKLGDDYKVADGSHRLGSDDFVF